jgi:dTDP-4-dehydrorhamnose 3,5-epimerase
MGIREVERHLGEVVVLRPDVFEDERGHFMEVFRSDEMRALGLPDRFVQENQSWSRRRVIRGLHFQYDPPMGKLMRVVSGKALLVAVDIRRGSPTLGRWCAVEATPENRLQVFAPPGFARGFCVESEAAEVLYKCTSHYNPRGESAIRWDDPAIGIAWPIARPVLSPKDATAQSLSDWLARPESALPEFSVAPDRAPG